MRYVKQQVTEFTYSNITQLYDDYDPDVTYSLEPDGSLTSVSVARKGGYYWRSVANGNQGNDPTEPRSKWWSEYSVSNKYAMLDQKSLTKSKNEFHEADADFLSTDAQTDIGLDVLVWDVVDNKMYESLDAGNDLPNTDFTDEALWKNRSDIIVEFTRERIDTIVLGYLETSSVKIEHFDDLGNKLETFTQERPYSVNIGVTNPYNIGTLPYSTEINKNVFFEVNPIGEKIRVTIERQSFTNIAACGYLVAGKYVDMGATLDGVRRRPNSNSVRTRNNFGGLTVAKRNQYYTFNFGTIFNSEELVLKAKEASQDRDEIMAFIIDPSQVSIFENIIVLGIMIEPETEYFGSRTKLSLDWTIEETI